jgi:Glycosyl hydrolase family 36 N-terminal domain
LTRSQRDLATQPSAAETATDDARERSAAAEPRPTGGVDRSRVLFDPGSGTWCLSMANSTYGFVIGDGGRKLRQLHWGAPVSLEALCNFPDPEGLVRDGTTLAWGQEAPLEYAAFGGRRFSEPALKVEFADGTRGVEWHVHGHRVDRDPGSETVAIELVDDNYPFAVELLYRIFDGEDVLERWARVCNRDGTESLVLRQAYSAAWWLPFADQWRLRYLHGGWARETQITETSLTPGKVVLESRRGTTSHLGLVGQIGKEPRQQPPNRPEKPTIRRDPADRLRDRQRHDLLITDLPNRARARDPKRPGEHVRCHNKGLQRSVHLVLQSRADRAGDPFLCQRPSPSRTGQPTSSL